LSFLRFLTQYESDIKSNYKSNKMIDVLVKVLAFALASGENFLPDPAAYDDLFYKLVETGEILTKFRDTFGLGNSGAMQILVNVSSHYHSLLADGRKGKHFSPEEVSVVIKQGYETLSIDSSEGLDAWDKYREADFKPLLKKIARAAVDDAKVLKSLLHFVSARAPSAHRDKTRRFPVRMSVWQPRSCPQQASTSAHLQVPNNVFYYTTSPTEGIL
jgi:hypothetical protein